MYKAKIISLDGTESNLLLSHKVGDIVEFADIYLDYLGKWVEVVEHYRIVTVKKERCGKCGNFILTRKKIFLE